jgi:hypothetical protein
LDAGGLRVPHQADIRCFNKEPSMLKSALLPTSLKDQAALDAIIKAKTEATLSRSQPLLDTTEVFSGLKALHQQRTKRAA